MLPGTEYKPDIQHSIAVYHYPASMDVGGVNELLARINGHMTILRGLHVEGIMISFKEMHKLDQSSLVALIESLSILHTKYELHIGFGDYPKAFFPVLLKFIKATPVSLFKTIEVMALAIGTSRLPTYSSILVYIEDTDEAKSIVSHLISKQYFVVMAHSKEDMLKRIHQKNSFDRIVVESHFGNLQEEVTVDFEKGIFTYSFQGSLDNDLSKSINIKEFKARLDFGYRVFIFDLNNIFHMDMHAAYILTDFLTAAKPYHAVICLVGLDKNKLNSNAYTIMDRSNFWSYKEKEDIYSDEEIILKLQKQHFHLQSQGISKRIIELIPKFIKATKQTLDRLGVKEFASQSKQCVVGKKPDLQPYISTHMNFAGDYVGEINFIFPKESVYAILERKEENPGELTKEDHIDMLKEFSGTVMGRLKANLEKRNHSIEAEFPYAVEYSDVDYDCIQHKYILETFYCDGKPFYVTVTDYIPPENPDTSK